MNANKLTRINANRMMYRPTWVEIDLEALKYNFGELRRFVGRDVAVLAVVKQDAYGHGLVQVSETLIEEGCEFLGVASVEEGMRLRESGVEAPILVLGHILKNNLEAIIKFNLIQTVGDLNLASALNKAAGKNKRKVKVHAKIDTGMGRIGVWHAHALEFIKGLSRLSNLYLDGIYTHFPSADCDLDFTRKQITDFNALLDSIRQSKIHIPYRHAANSMGILNFKEAHFNLVRPGLALYGVLPDLDAHKRIVLKPVMSLKARVVYLKDVPAGRGISYGRTHITERPTKVATLPVGYGDGYPFALSNKASVLIRGERAQIVGRVCMDWIMVDVGHIKGVKVGDEGFLFGRSKSASLSVEEVATYANTIPYEILCSINSRLPRIYR